MASPRTRLSFNNADLDEFPQEIFAKKNVTDIDLFRGISWEHPTIPKEIGKLKGLRRLTLGGNGFTQLPDEIGQLGNLEVLALDYCERLRSLPRAIGKMRSLRELSLGYC